MQTWQWKIFHVQVMNDCIDVDVPCWTLLDCRKLQEVFQSFRCVAAVEHWTTCPAVLLASKQCKGRGREGWSGFGCNWGIRFIKWPFDYFEFGQWWQDHWIFGYPTFVKPSRLFSARHGQEASCWSGLSILRKLQLLCHDVGVFKSGYPQTIGATDHTEATEDLLFI